jgi:hypothetical protein
MIELGERRKQLSDGYKEYRPRKDYSGDLFRLLIEKSNVPLPTPHLNHSKHSFRNSAIYSKDGNSHPYDCRFVKAHRHYTSRRVSFQHGEGITFMF